MNPDHDRIPDELRPIDRALTSLAEREQALGREASGRVATATAGLLSPRSARSVWKLPPLWVSLGAPLAAAAAITLIVSTGGVRVEPVADARVLAADLEDAIGVWERLDGAWAGSDLDDEIALLSLETASTAAGWQSFDGVTEALDPGL